MNPPSRRQFLRSSGILVLGSSFNPLIAGAQGPEGRGSQPSRTAPGSQVVLPVIDIHQHVGYKGRFDRQLVTHQAAMGIDRTVLLPSGMALTQRSTHEGKSNGLAAGVHPTEAAVRLAERVPGRFVWFCNEVPDHPEARARLEAWLKKGARGIGEQKFNIECTSRPMHMVAELAGEYGVPVLIHFQHGKYNTGFENFHRMLEKYPGTNFIGHAQTWWGNIDKNHVQEEMYPKAPVTPGGLTDRYLADYPNMFGDLSAGSGRNSLTRDEDHARDFLVRHQDKLLFGSDCHDIDGVAPKCIGSDTLAILRRLVVDKAPLDKILGGNAMHLLSTSPTP